MIISMVVAATSVRDTTAEFIDEATVKTGVFTALIVPAPVLKCTGSLLAGVT